MKRLDSLRKYLVKENIYFMFLFFFSISIPFSNHIANDFMILSLLAWFFTVKKNFRGDWLLSVMGLLTVSYIISSIVNWGNVPSEFVKSHTSVSKEIFSLATPFIWFFIVRSAPISWKKISFLLGSFATAVFANTLLQMVLNKAPYSLVANNRLSFYYNPNFSAGLMGSQHFSGHSLSDTN